MVATRLFACLVLFSGLYSFSSSGQPAPGENKLSAYQDTLARLGDTIINGPFAQVRTAASHRFITTLVNALKEPRSFQYDFDAVENLSILYAPDSSFRVMSWYVATGPASYRFYGAIQMNREPLKLFGLVDHTPEFSNPEDTTTSYKKWLGAHYYEIIETSYKGRTCYLLLGWKGKDHRTTQRIIETLAFRDGMPFFGLPVLQTPEGLKKRILFEYSSQVSMMLKYLPEERLIVFDHLAPSDPDNEGDYAFYGPDLSYDALKPAKGLWQWQEHVELRNDKDIRDKLFNDPEKMKDIPSGKLPPDQ